MLLKAIKNTRASEEQLRESYRRRLDEIFSSPPAVESLPENGSTVGEVPLAILETEPADPGSHRRPVLVPVDNAVAAEAPDSGPVDLDGATTRIAQSLSSCLASAFDSLKTRQAAETGGRLKAMDAALEHQAERLNALAASFDQSQGWQRSTDSRLTGQTEAIGRLTASVESALETLRTLRSEQDSQAGCLASLSAALAQLAEAQPALQAQLAAQAASVAELTAAVAEMARAQQAMQARLDAQAEALRQLNARRGAQQAMLDSYRDAVERLREITAVQTLPVTLPDNL